MLSDSDRLVVLDIDGVLNDHNFDEEAMSNRISPICVVNLNMILRETGARIVLSSAWRYHFYRAEMNLIGLDWLFRTHGVATVRVPPGAEEIPRIIGITRADTMEVTPDGPMPIEDERGRQISDWVAENGFKGRYVVIDDGGKRRDRVTWTDMGIGSAGHPVVWTKGEIGMTDDDARKAIAILGGR